jgi:hypothetical protein
MTLYLSVLLPAVSDLNMKAMCISKVREILAMKDWTAYVIYWLLMANVAYL